MKRTIRKKMRKIVSCMKRRVKEKVSVQSEVG